MAGLAPVIPWFLLVLLGAGAAAAGEVKLGDTVRSGIHTEAELESDPFGYRVVWIEWDSAFRQSELRLGDRILGVDGQRYTREGYGLHQAIGDYAEPAFWAARGAGEGSPVTLIVERDGAEIEVPGQVRAERFYWDDAGKRAMDASGPERLGSEGGRFGSPWAAWYEGLTNGMSGSFPYTLDGGWERSAFNNRKELEAMLGQKERIDYLAATYPGAFAETVRADWLRVIDYLDGEAVALPDDALAYRTRAEVLRGTVRQHAQEAIATFERGLGERLDRGLAGGGVDGLRKSHVGRVVRLDGLSYRNLINDLDKTYMVAGDVRDGVLLLDAATPEMDAAFTALQRYRTLVNPGLAERFTVWIVVEDKPRIVTRRGDPAMGLLGRLAALGAGEGEVFIDAGPEPAQVVFAGERETKVEPSCAVSAGDPPETTIRCMVASIKAGDRATWESLFAEWRFYSYGPRDTPLYDPDYGLPSGAYERDWESSRKLIMGPVLDARVARAAPVRVLHESTEGDPVPRMESVCVVLDHVGLVDGAPRTFTNLEVRRVWRLQRRDGGPWKIADVQHL